MHKTAGVIILLLLFSPILLAHDAPSIADLGWLSGCWAAVSGDPGSVEQWTRPAGETLFGVNRTVQGGKTVAHEFMQIRRDASGEIVFISSPSGQKKTTFRLVEHGEANVVFENKNHDFPQRVIYKIASDGTLAARIEGSKDGIKTIVPFPMKRMACD